MQRGIPDGWPAEAALVRAVGSLISARIEPASRPERIDHVWLELDCGLHAPVLIAVNTRSLRNLDAGFDPRVRLGTWRETWKTLPDPQVTAASAFRYAEHETRVNIFYEFLERRDLERILLEAARLSLRITAIGTPYHRPRLGLHQIHSRHASCAVAEERDGLDGALCFHLATDREARWMFFKFCGQP